jgi:predicted amidohydrolase
VPVAPFGVACMQTAVNHIMHMGERDEKIMLNLQRSIDLLDWASGGSRVVVFPEFWLQGYERHYTFEDFQRLSFNMRDREFQMLCEAAAKHNVYLCGSIWENDDDWPDRVFNTVFLIGPDGKLAARHHKVTCLNMAGALADTTPGDIYSAYVERYGDDYLFPVVDTPYGRIGMISSFEIHYPEQARQLGLQGVELILHSSAEVNGFHRHAWQAARQTRAFDNVAYLASANIGLDYADKTPLQLQHGHSQIIDFNGTVISIVDGAGEAILSAQIDIAALRRRRAEQRNWLANTPSDLWVKLYRENEGCPVDLFLDEPLKDKQRGPAALRANLARLQDRGTFVRP